MNGKVTSVPCLLKASLSHKDVAVIMGELRNKAVRDPDMTAKTNDIISQVKNDPRMKSGKPFHVPGLVGVTLGGVREDFFSKETAHAANQQLTWAVRHADVKYWVEVDAQGNMTIDFNLYDRLDLSPNGSGTGYDFISSGLGFVYHGVLTGNQFMQTRMSWSVNVSAGQNSSNSFIFR